MKIGITYDLRNDYLAMGYNKEETAEFDSPGTIEAIENAIQQLGHEAVRIGHLQHLAQRLLNGESWQLVFNIAEGLHGIGREAQVPCLLDAYRVPYTFSDPLVSSLTLHKGMTKHVIRDHHIPTTPFVVIEKISDLEKVDLPYPLFAKPVAEGTGKGISSASKIRNYAELRAVVGELLATYREGIIVETYLGGREFTVGIVGTGEHARVLGTLEIILKADADKEVYSYINKQRHQEFVQYLLVDDELSRKSEKVALDAWNCLKCRDGGRIDLRCDDSGVPHFMEVNPLPGLNPIDSDLPILCTKLGISYVELIGYIVSSAITRIK